MRKNIVAKDRQANLPVNDGQWLDIEQLAQVEITSEDSAFPIEGALTANGGAAWRAAEEGSQTIRITFDEPQQVGSIYLFFEEHKQARTQEFVLRWSPGNEQPMQEIVRQQYNFSPGSSTEEQENYTVELKDVKIIELHIIPDMGNPHALASLSSLRIA